MGRQPSIVQGSIIGCLLLVLVVGASRPAAARPAAAPPVAARFAAFWAAHDGALLFGQPLTSDLAQGELIVQWFERARLEWHPTWPAGRQITLGRLGAELLGGQTLPPIAPFASHATHRYFPETGHSIQGEILRFWERHGGLPIFGYP